MVDQKNTEPTELEQIHYFLKNEYGDGSKITKMQELRQDFQNLRLLGRRSREARNIVFRVLVTTLTGAALVAAWVGVKQQIFPGEDGG